MSSLNRVQAIGNLGRDPKIRSMQNGGKVANLSVGVSERWTDKQSGDRRERTEWLRCVAFGPLADVCERYLKKGSKVYVEGKLSTRKWTDQQGQDRYSTEVVMQGFDGKLVMLDGAPRDGNQQAQQEPSQDYGGGSSGAGVGGYALDDSIPFAPCR